ncbi:hypothetical protein MHU86_4870 [Fragilaria crotonensis]|nr:hypothetical protein MHU86_4870 [Fragilaria crotonensis]
MEFQTNKMADARIYSFLSANVITALIDAMAFEPATLLPSGELLVYSVAAPIAPLDHYLCDFTHNKSMVVSNCELAVCLGPTSLHSHTFMIGEGRSQLCEGCRSHMCISSVAGLCITCLGVGGGVNFEDASVARLSEGELRNALSKKMEVPALLPIGDLLELYVNVAENNSMDSLGLFLLEHVTFPIYPPIALNQDQGTLKYLLRFDFYEGGRFLRNNILSTKQRCGLINLFACLVTFCKTESTSPKAATVIPNTISYFAKNARVDSGERLMKRAIRHSLDTKAPPILHAQAFVIEHHGKIGLVIEDKIAASMKDDIYNVEVGFTPSKLLGSACDCNAGSDVGSDSGKHICVHCLPVLYKLTLLLFGGLAEHLLVEFASCFARHHEAEMSEEEKAIVMEVILTFVESSMGASAGETLSCTKSPSDVLAQFSVGTELNKRKLPEPPNPSELRPLREFKRILPEAKAKLVLNMKQEPPRLSVSNSILPSQPALASAEERQPDYITTSRLCHVLLSCLGKPMENLLLDETAIVGIRLLELRAEKLSLTTMAKELIELGLQEKVNALVDGAKLRRRPKCLSSSSSCRAKEPGVARDIGNVEMTFMPTNNGAKVLIDDESNSMLNADDTAVVNGRPGKTKQRERKIGIRRCCFTDCNNSTERGSQRVPAMPPKPGAGASQQRWETFFRKKCHRQEFLRRIGENTNDQRTNLRICSCHPKESKPVSIKYTVKIPDAGTGRRRNWKDKNSIKTIPFSQSPNPVGREQQSSRSTHRTGIKRDRNNKTNCKISWTTDTTKRERSICTYKPWRDSKRCRHQ